MCTFRLHESRRESQKSTNLRQRLPTFILVASYLLADNNTACEHHEPQPHENDICGDGRGVGRGDIQQTFVPYGVTSSSTINDDNRDLESPPTQNWERRIPEMTIMFSWIVFLVIFFLWALARSRTPMRWPCLQHDGKQPSPSSARVIARGGGGDKHARWRRTTNRAFSSTLPQIPFLPFFVLFLAAFVSGKDNTSTRMSIPSSSSTLTSTPPLNNGSIAVL